MKGDEKFKGTETHRRQVENGGWIVTNHLSIPLTSADNGASVACVATNEPMESIAQDSVSLDVKCNKN